MSSEYTLIIINRKSRNGRTDLSAAIQLLKNQGFNVIEESPEAPSDLPELIRRHRNSISRIIIGGGDGTLNAAAEAVLESRLPLGILPLGTANDLARTLHIPTDLIQASRIIADDHLRTIDLGCVNEKYFFNVAHIGLGVQVAHHLSSTAKAWWGPLSYARSALTAIQKNRSFRARIKIDGRELSLKSTQIAVGNGRFYGGGMIVAEGAAIDDHRLFLYSLKPLPLWKLIMLVPALRKGEHRDKEEVSVMEGQSVTIETQKTMLVCADGERVTHTPARFGLLPNAIAVYAPPDEANSIKET